MLGNSKNYLKVSVIIFANVFLCGGCMDNIVFLYMTVNVHIARKSI